VIVADTGAVLALLDADEEHHRALRSLFETAPDRWILPWAILPEVDYLVGTQLGPRAEEMFLADLADGRFAVEWGRDEDVAAANRICAKYRALRLGLVDGVVIAVAERLKAAAIATLDLRHFAAVTIRGAPKLLPRDDASRTSRSKRRS
jgi:predicted nucleic acid-binding protein